MTLGFVWVPTKPGCKCPLSCPFCSHLKPDAFLLADSFDCLQDVSAHSAVPFARTVFLNADSFAFRWISGWFTGGKCPLSGPFCWQFMVWKLTPFLSAEFFDDLQIVSARSLSCFISCAKTDFSVCFSWIFGWQVNVSARSAVPFFVFEDWPFFVSLIFWMTESKCSLSCPFCLHFIVWRLIPFLSAESFDDLQRVSGRSAVPLLALYWMKIDSFPFGWLFWRFPDGKCPLCGLSLITGTSCYLIFSAFTFSFSYYPEKFGSDFALQISFGSWTEICLLRP